MRPEGEPARRSQDTWRTRLLEQSKPAVCDICGRTVFWNALVHTVEVIDGQVTIYSCAERPKTPQDVDPPTAIPERQEPPA